SRGGLVRRPIPMVPQTRERDRKEGPMDSDPRSPGPPVDARPGPGMQNDPQFRELMDEESPDGRPPTAPVRRESRLLFLSILAVVTIAVVAALIWRSG